MQTKLQLNEINKEMAKYYRQIYGADVVGIFLYGSYARGDYDSESDIDFAAIVHGDRIGLQQKLKKIWDLSAELGLENDVVISPIVIPYDEFKQYQKVLPYYNNILTEGKRIG